MKKHLLFKLLLTFSLVLFTVGWVNGQIISQYIDTDSGTTPKGIEIWNNTGSSIDFSVTNLEIWKGTNGGAPSLDVTVNSGILADGDVWVIGTSDIGTYLTGEGLGSNYTEEAFTFNGDDALEVYLDGVKTDVFGDPGADPGTGWSGSGVQTWDQNISLLSGITTGDTDGWTDPSIRFETTNTDNSLTGFGVAPVVVADTDPPVATFDPADSETDVSITINPTISFNEAIYTSPAGVLVDNSNVEGLITFEEGANTVNFSASISENVITIVPDADLENNKSYTITLDIVEDEAGNAMLSAPTATFTTIALKAEPTNHVTGFTATANTYNHISLEWTDAVAETQAPDAYLIKASTGAITAPVDGTDPAEDTDLSDGDAIVKVLYAEADSVAFENLLPGTTYNFQIWSYTNEGTSIDFKLDVAGPSDNAATGNSELFFSEYIEGSSNNKAVEIYNGTGGDVDLSSYSVKTYFNGQSTPGSTEDLSGILTNGDVYIISYGSADNATIISESDITSAVTNFNGNDAVELVKDGVSIDVFGTISEDPGSAWDVAGTSNATIDHTIIRKTGRTYGNTDWTSSAGTTEDDSEWIVMPQDYTNNLGAYRDINSDATLSDLTVDATTVSGFASGTNTYNVELPYGTTEVPTVAGTATDATYAIIEVTQAQNLTGTEAERTATVTVTADDLSTQDYTIVFSIAANTENDITSFVFADFDPDINGVINSGDHTVTVDVPYGTDVTSLVPTIEVSAGATISPESGVAPDFTSPVNYTVTAEDASEQIWEVTVNIEPNTENDIVTFVFESFDPDVEGVVNSGDYTVTLSVPYGTNVTALVPTITVSPEATISPESGVAQDFTNPVNYTVTAEDASEQIWDVTVDVSAPNTDATLSDLKVNSSTVTGFDPATYSYVIELPYGTTETPTVTATENDPNAEVVISDATDITSETNADRTTTVTVTAEDGTTTQDYTILFNVAEAGTDASLSDLKIDDTIIEEFSGLTFEYYDTLAAGTTTVPTVTATASDPDANVDIVPATDLSGTEAERTTTVTVTAQDGVTEKVYTVTFYVKSDDATLSDLTVDGATVNGFNPSTLEYNVELPYGTTDEPVVAAIANDPNAKIDITQATDVEGDVAARTATIVVTAEDENYTETYTVIFSVALNDDATLSDLTIDGETVDGFDTATYTYNVELPYGTTEEPVVDATTSDPNATTVITQATDVEGDLAARTATVVVTAEDGTTELTYSVIFTIAEFKELFISEYVEGQSNGNNRAIELYNPSSSEIDLSNYIVKQSYNGGGWAIRDGEEMSEYILPLTGIVASGDVFLVYNNDADQAIVDVGDLGLSYGTGCDGCRVPSFTGDDAIGLFKVEGEDTVLIDIVGEELEKGPWDVAGTVDATQNYTLIRKYDTSVGNTDWTTSAGTNENDSEWEVYPADYIDNLGAPTEGLNDEAEITDFTFGVDIDLENAVISSANGEVDITVINGTDVTALTPTITVSDGAEISPASGAEQDFTDPLVYTVTAEDGTTTKDWTVTVTVSATLSDLANIIEVELADMDSIIINDTDTTVTIYAPYGFGVTSVKPEFTVSAGATIADTADARDFIDPQNYVVTAQNGSTVKNWEVSVISPVPVELSIYDIQYTENASGYSEYLDDFVKTSGLVIATNDYGYFIQDGDGAWNGLYVYNSSETRTIGDSVEVVGTVDEYYGLTRIVDVKVLTINNQGNDLPEPTVVTVAQALTEDFESVFVVLENVTCTNPDAGFGMFEVADENDTILIDDDFYAFTPTEGSVYSITGLGYYSFSERKVIPRSEDDINAAPSISGITLDPITPSSSDDVTISTTITDDRIGAAELTVGLYYGDNEGSEDTEVTFEQVETTDEFEGTIPASDSEVFYKITASDGDLTSTVTGSYSITTGINNPDGIVSMNVYPNPSNGAFTLEMNASKAGTFNMEIINIQGQVIYQKQISQDGFYRESIDISQKARGIYYIRINDGKSMKISKIIIQ